MRTGASSLAFFVSWLPVSSGRFSLARGSLISLSSLCSSSWSISWPLKRSQHSICACTSGLTLRCCGFQPLWVLLPRLLHEPWCCGISSLMWALLAMDFRFPSPYILQEHHSKSRQALNRPRSLRGRRFCWMEPSCSPVVLLWCVWTDEINSKVGEFPFLNKGQVRPQDELQIKSSVKVE